MVKFYEHSDTVHVYVLPAARCGEAEQLLKAARNSGRRLETAYDLLKEQLVGMANRVKKADLVEGHRYGYLFLSHTATAEREGKMIPNHGEIYIGTAVYQRQPSSNVGVLTYTNGWGADGVVQVPEGMLLLDLP